MRSNEPQNLHVSIGDHSPQRDHAQGSEAIVGAHDPAPCSRRTNTLEWVLVGSRNGRNRPEYARVFEGFDDPNGRPTGTSKGRRTVVMTVSSCGVQSAHPMAQTSQKDAL